MITRNFYFPRLRNCSQILLSSLNKIVCYNQGKYIQFEYLLSEHHKLLKIETYKQNPSINAIKKYYDQLISYTVRSLSTIAKYNFDYISRYYEVQHRSKFSPRICIKTVKEGKIADLFRSDPSAYEKEYPIGSNTGFRYVVKNGLYYLCNYIPKTARTGDYENPRLDPDCAKAYKTSLISRLKCDEIDPRWCRCWKKEGGKQFVGWQLSCYKSTLIVPMTLINNDLDDAFRTTFFKDNPPDIKNKTRTIWGFLCLDHPSVNYFRQLEDIYVGYIFADLLSLYLISLYIHTDRSDTFRLASDILTREKGV